jgi:hypothetical protein
LRAQPNYWLGLLVKDFSTKRVIKFFWFPSKGKRMAGGNQKESLIPFKRVKAGSRESKEVFTSLQKEKAGSVGIKEVPDFFIIEIQT